jgi:hypothetical protein
MTIELDVIANKNKLLKIAEDEKRSEQERDKAQFGVKLCTWFLSLLKLDAAVKKTATKDDPRSLFDQVFGK